MKEVNVCQSCSMPLDGKELWGTEKDGTKNKDYCKFCYKDGAFTNPGISLAEMKEHMFKIMEKQNLPADILEAAISRLPGLKRWRSSVNSEVK